MKTRKLTVLESRAASACAEFAKFDGGTFSMMWKKSATWGRCPSIAYRGEKAAHASGCGYDKESACLCEFLSSLAPDGIHASGAGFRTVVDKLAMAGWLLEKTYSGATEDGYRLSRKPATAPAI